MKLSLKLISLILALSALLCLCACTSRQKPKAALLPKSRGTVVFDEEQFGADMDFTGKEKLVIIGDDKNAFHTYYYFHDDSVRLKYDNLETELVISALPDTNLALLIYRIGNELLEGEVNWHKVEKKYVFDFKINNASCSGECNAQGKLLSFEVPEYRVYYKAEF